jgi:hydroxyacylglutathione hydrolase
MSTGGSSFLKRGGAMIVEQLTIGMFQVNTWLVGDKVGGEAFVIDPGGDNDRVLALAAKYDLTIGAILNTHGHIDHVTGAAELAEQLKIPFRLHGEDLFLLDSIDDSCAMFGLPPVKAPVPGQPLVDDEEILVGELKIRVIHTPGHSPGGVCFLIGSELFAGDTLFSGSIGRTDLPGGDMETLMASIFERLIDPLPAAIKVHCGHGPDTSLSEEAASNPFLLSWRR